MILKTRMLGQTYEFKDVKDVLAKASEKKSGDELAGVGAESALERIAAKEVLAQLNVELDIRRPVKHFNTALQRIIQISAALVYQPKILIFDEPTAVLTPQEIDELMEIMRGFKKEGKSILFITHKLNEIMAVADRCTVLRKGKYMGTVDIKDTTKEELSRRMVGRDVQLQVEKQPAHPGETVLDVENVTIHNDQRKKDVVKDVSFKVHAGEIVCLAGIEGNGQTEFIYGLTGLSKLSSGKLVLDGKDITHESIRQRSKDGMGHIPEDRHKHGLVLDFSLENNIVLQRYWQPEFQKGGFIRADKVREYSDRLIEQYDVRSGQGSVTTVRSMSGGNQQKAIIAREIDRDPKLLVAVQPTRGLDVGAIEYIHKQIVDERVGVRGGGVAVEKRFVEVVHRFLNKQIRDGEDRILETRRQAESENFFRFFGGDFQILPAYGSAAFIFQKRNKNKDGGNILRSDAGDCDACDVQFADDDEKQV